VKVWSKSLDNKRRSCTQKELFILYSIYGIKQGHN
jgi:hypothetical protein